MLSRTQEVILVVLVAIFAGFGYAMPSGVAVNPHLFDQPPEYFRININTADWTELDLLPGIGPKRAQEIVLYRREHGPFRQVSDLSVIKGIGESVINKIAKMATVE